MEYKWNEQWEALFEEQVKLLKSDIARAKAADQLVVYLSCPISSRGGGFHGTNVDIAKHTQDRLMTDWGQRFWILNPARYQMESKEGTGLIQRHAETLEMPLEELEQLPRPSGGDYMRMWTKVLVEDDGEEPHQGRDFDAFYFIGPTDVRHFFTRGGAVNVTAGIEEYFSRKFAIDPDFRDYYSRGGIQWDRSWTDRKEPKKRPADQQALVDGWEAARKDFFRFYAVRASANFSLGCHDEWNIFRMINETRLKETATKKYQGGDTGIMLAGFFDGRQIDPGAAFTPISVGYAVS